MWCLASVKATAIVLGTYKLTVPRWNPTLSSHNNRGS
jgi:hypothetical protein